MRSRAVARAEERACCCWRTRGREWALQVASRRIVPPTPEARPLAAVYRCRSLGDGRCGGFEGLTACPASRRRVHILHSCPRSVTGCGGRRSGLSSALPVRRSCALGPLCACRQSALTSPCRSAPTLGGVCAFVRLAGSPSRTVSEVARVGHLLLRAASPPPLSAPARPTTGSCPRPRSRVPRMKVRRLPADCPCPHALPALPADCPCPTASVPTCSTAGRCRQSARR